MTKPLNDDGTEGQEGQPYGGPPGYEHVPQADSDADEDPKEIRRRAREAMKAAKAQLRAAREPLPFDPLIMGLTIAGIIFDLVLAGGLMMAQTRGTLYDNIDAYVQDSIEKDVSAGPLRAYATGSIKGLITHAAPIPVADISFVDANNKPHKLSEFKGRVVVLNVWASWCEPCRREMPTLASLQKQYPGKSLKVLPLSIDNTDKIPEAKRFIGMDMHRPLDLYVDTNFAAPSQFGIKGMPATLIIDKQGREVARLNGEALWDTPEVKALMDKLTQ